MDFKLFRFNFSFGRDYIFTHLLYYVESAKIGLLFVEKREKNREKREMR